MKSRKAFVLITKKARNMAEITAVETATIQPAAVVSTSPVADFTKCTKIYLYV